MTLVSPWHSRFLNLFAISPWSNLSFIIKTRSMKIDDPRERILYLIFIYKCPSCRWSWLHRWRSILCQCWDGHNVDTSLAIVLNCRRRVERIVTVVLTASVIWHCSPTLQSLPSGLSCHSASVQYKFNLVCNGDHTPRPHRLRCYSFPYDGFRSFRAKRTPPSVSSSCRGLSKPEPYSLTFIRQDNSYRVDADAGCLLLAVDDNVYGSTASPHM